jgi:hypothetical protein
VAAVHGRRGYPVDVEFGPATRQSRLTLFFRLVLVLPALVFASVLQVVLYTVAFLGWFASLALGRLPEGMRELGAYCLRYETQMVAYVLLLTSAYPSLAGATGEPQPATTALQEPE